MSIITSYEDKIKLVPYKPEQIIFCEDTANTYLDVPGNKRVHINQTIIDKRNKSAIDAIIAPLTDKIYRACDTGLLYTFYNGTSHCVGGYEELIKTYQNLEGKISKIESGMKSNVLERLKLVDVETQNGKIPLINNREYRVTVWVDMELILPSFVIGNVGKIVVHINRNNGDLNIGTDLFTKNSESIPNKGYFDIEYNFNPHRKLWVATITSFDVR